MSMTLNVMSIIQSVALYNAARPYQAGVFFGVVFGIYSLHQRLFMLDKYDFKTAMVTAPILLLHLEFWKCMTTTTSRAFDLGVRGRLLGT